MSNNEYREAQQQAREHGLKARHEQRLENATYTAAEVKVLTEAALRLGRKEAGEDLRFLAEARKDYCHRCPETQNDMREMDPTALGVHDGHATASWLADIIDGTNDAKGWLPSWRWGEWAERTSQPAPDVSSARTDLSVDTDLPQDPQTAREAL